MMSKFVIADMKAMSVTNISNTLTGFLTASKKMKIVRSWPTASEGNRKFGLNVGDVGVVGAQPLHLFAWKHRITNLAPGIISLFYVGEVMSSALIALLHKIYFQGTVILTSFFPTIKTALCF